MVQISRTNSWDGRDDFTKFQFVEDGGFTSGVQSYHQYSHLFLAEEAFEEICEHITHGGALCGSLSCKITRAD
jgi:hypothetical protein